MMDWQQGEGYVRLGLQGLDVYSCYFSPNRRAEAFEVFLNELGTCLRSRGCQAIVAGDFNAKSHQWGSPVEDERGRTLSEWAAQNDLVVLNDGKVPTFQRGSSKSYIDLTLVTSRLVGASRGWKVEVDENFSLHNNISFEVAGGGGNGGPSRMGYERPTKAAIRRALRECEHMLRDPTDVERWSRVLATASRKVSKGGKSGGRKSVYFWSDELAQKKKVVDNLRRRLMRLRDRGATDTALFASSHEEWRAAKKDLGSSIRRQKRRCWQDLLEELERDPWGKGYKIVTDKLRIPPQKAELSKDRRGVIIRDLFPEGRPLEPLDGGEEGTVTALTIAEVAEAAGRLKEGKAPGEDGIPPEVVKCFAESYAPLCAGLLGSLFNRGVFPSVWKTAKVVLIPKPGRDGGESSDYRPICLINTLGKLYEAVILGRLDKELVRTGGLSPRQYGFRRGRSTVAVEEVLTTAKEANRRGEWALLILLDIKNAFNRASWGKIMEKLERREIDWNLRRILRSYLSDRTIFAGGDERIFVSMGVPQGSILGPTLWNILYNDLLEMEWRVEVKLVAYADDLAVVVTHKKERELSRIATEALTRINGWMGENELELALQKTEMIMLAGMRRPKDISVYLAGTRLALKKEVKYLGIVIDKSTTFRKHVDKVCRKAEKAVASLSRILPNVGGPKEGKRKILAGITNSIILYGAQVWADAIRIGKNRLKLLSVQRRMALRVCSGYRTVSTEAAMVVAGVIPIDLLVRERQQMDRLEGGKKERCERARAATMQSWQGAWVNSEKGVWTRRLIGDVGKWKGRRHGEVSYHLTQLLTGHGAFAQYLDRFRLKQGAACSVCGREDTPYHLMVECESWAREMEEMGRSIGEVITPDNVIEVALRGKREWDATLGRMATLMKGKEDRMRLEG